jgi:multidrug resistance efflux pump
VSAAAQADTTTTIPADTNSLVTMAKVTGAELLRALRTEADPTAAEAEVEAIRAAARQRAAEADRWRADAEAAVEEMTVQMDAAQVMLGGEVLVAIVSRRYRREA